MAEEEKSTIVLNENCTVQFDASAATNLMTAFQSAEITRNITLTQENVGGIEGLNLYCTYGSGIVGQNSSTVGASYRKNLTDNFDYEVSGEYSGGSYTISLMIINKPSGVSFGIEYKLTGNFAKLQQNGFYGVIKAPICGVEFVLKFDIAAVAGIIVDILGVVCSMIGSDDGDKAGAANVGCDLIIIVFDFVYGKIEEKVLEYESIKEYATKKENIRDNIFTPVKEVGTQKLVKEIPIVNTHEHQLLDFISSPLRCVRQGAHHTYVATPRRQETHIVGEVVEGVGAIAVGGICVVGEVAKVVCTVAVCGVCVAGFVGLCFTCPLLSPLAPITITSLIAVPRML